ncbi:cytosolic sulfotransferase 3-like [Anneissia japonica]|uniref:cytosolic sulfotransferase 3-like n=1 Tax=Anneissia japonica TaxID=1529436 RepID=UPI0014257682|nr:cytosolic sulfotransferase 3-like [Anneissia japonica]
MNSYWWSQRNDKNVLFVKYEDMQRSLSDVVEKVASFLGWPITDKNLPELLKHWRVGDWKNHFTVAESEAFDELYREKMAGTGLKFDYEL